jgi:hypothetical protein
MGERNYPLMTPDFFFKQPCSAAREAGGRVPRSPCHQIIARRAARFQPAAPRRPVPDHRAATSSLKPVMAPAEFHRALARRPASVWSRRRQRGVRIASARHCRPFVARRPAAARILRWLPFNISSPGLLVIFRRFPCDISS